MLYFLEMLDFDVLTRYDYVLIGINGIKGYLESRKIGIQVSPILLLNN